MGVKMSNHPLYYQVQELISFFLSISSSIPDSVVVVIQQSRANFSFHHLFKYSSPEPSLYCKLGTRIMQEKGIYNTKHPSSIPYFHGYEMRIVQMTETENEPIRIQVSNDNKEAYPAALQSQFGELIQVFSKWKQFSNS